MTASPRQLTHSSYGPGRKSPAVADVATGHAAVLHKPPAED
ncbi:hypothetical protein ACQB60_06680 [Actinomycetota bacterium Odt1-20B]